MNQSVQQVREQDTPKDRARKINDLAINFDNRINALRAKLEAVEIELDTADDSFSSVKNGSLIPTHNILSPLHKDTTPNACVRGDLITGQGVIPTWQRLALGAPGEVLMATVTDAQWVALPVFTGFANPTAEVGLAAVNGVATTAMRSDGAPALSQAIIPTWTGMHTFNNVTYSALFTGGNVGIKTALPDYDLDVAGSIGIDDYLHHNGDPNTYLYFSTDRTMVYVGGKWLLDMNTVAAQDYVKIGDGTDIDINLNDDLTIDGATGAVTIANLGLGIVHSSAAGLLTSSAIINSDLGILGTQHYVPVFGATGFLDSIIRQDVAGTMVGVDKLPVNNAFEVNGVIDATTGYRVNNVATDGHYLRGNGTNFVSSALLVGDLPAHNLLSATHGDTSAAAVIRGDIIVGIGASPTWTRVAISPPAATFMNYFGAANGDLEPGYKALFDATVPGTIAESAAAAAGTATVAARRDHTHGAPATWTPSAHTHTHASTTGQTANDHHNQAHAIDGADHTLAGSTAGYVLRATAATTFAFGTIGNTSLGNLGTAGTLSKFGATGLADSLLSETADDVIIPTGKRFGLGAGKGGLTFTDAATDTITFDTCNVGIGITPTTKLHLYENNASVVPQILIEQDDTGDAALEFLLTGGQAYTMGIDNSVAGDILKISPTTSLGATLPFCMNASGEIGINIAPLALHNMRISNATTDASGRNIYATMSGTANVNGTYSNSVFALDVGQYGAANNTGSIIGFQMSSYHYGAGNLSLLSGGYYFYGNHNGSGATSEAIGQYIGLVKRSGNITNCYDLYLAPALVTSGTATNEWAICSDHVAPSKFVHDVRFMTDTYGTVYGAANDVRILYDGTNTVFHTLVGNANYIFDGYTTVDTDCSVKIAAGEAKDAILTFQCDEGDDVADQFRLRTVYNATSSSNLFKLQCDNAVKDTFVDLVTVTTAGLVGIGITPLNKFHVVGPNSTPVSLAEVDDNSICQFQARTAITDSLYICALASNRIGLQATDGTIDSTTARNITLNPFGGNVGVGCAPVSLFEIQGGLTTVGSVLTLGTKEPTVVVNDVLGRINFYAPLEADGGDALLVGASIVAVAEDTFSATVNKTSLLFQTGASEVATTKMFLTSSGNLSIGGTVAPVERLVVKRDVVAGSINTAPVARFQNAQGDGNFVTLHFSGAVSDGMIGFLDSTTATTRRMSFGASAASASDLTILGSGSIVLGTQAALATSATDGFVYIPTCAGAPTGVPTAYTGKVAMVYDITNDEFYIYNGGWKSGAAFS